MKINKKILVVLMAIIAISYGCKKSYLETNPTDQISNNEMFETTGAAYTALNGIHSFMISWKEFDGNHANFGAMAIAIENDMMGNDMVGQPTGYDWFHSYYTYVATEAANYWMPYQMWLFYYRIINNANAIIQNIDGAEGPQSEKDDIKGQALAYRAWAYLGLVTHFQHAYQYDPNAPGVPIYTTTTTTETIGTGRGTLKENYDMINADIKKAIELLANAPQHSDKAMISLATAQGLYSRIALAEEDWATAATMAEQAMQSFPLMSAQDLLTGFNSNSNEAWMWASSYTSEQYNEAGILCFISFMDASIPGYASVGATRSITQTLYNKMDSNDVRRQWFNPDYTQRKFRAQTPNGFVADDCYMRVGEMYLNLAEAKYHLGDEAAARQVLEDLITVRDPSYVAPSGGSALLDEILLQRRIELWGEGFGYTDIVRLQQPLNRPLGPKDHQLAVCRVSTLPANSPRFLFKIPSREIDTNPNIGPDDQNP